MELILAHQNESDVGVALDINCGPLKAWIVNRHVVERDNVRAAINGNVVLIQHQTTVARAGDDVAIARAGLGTNVHVVSAHIVVLNRQRGRRGEDEGGCERGNGSSRYLRSKPTPPQTRFQHI